MHFHPLFTLRMREDTVFPASLLWLWFPRELHTPSTSRSCLRYSRIQLWSHVQPPWLDIFTNYPPLFIWLPFFPGPQRLDVKARHRTIMSCHGKYTHIFTKADIPRNQQYFISYARIATLSRTNQKITTNYKYTPNSSAIRQTPIPSSRDVMRFLRTQVRMLLQ